jgi:hypothetical protein
MRRQRGEDRDPPPAAGDDQPDRPVARTGPGQQRVDLRLRGVEVELQPDVRRGALEPLEVLVPGVRAAAVEAGHLEHAVAAQQTVVGDGDRHLLGGPDGAVDRCQLVHAPEGTDHGRADPPNTTITYRSAPTIWPVARSLQ